MRKRRNPKRLRALANSSLISIKEERDNAQNPGRSRGLEEGIGSKLLNTTICPKRSSDYVALVLVKG